MKEESLSQAEQQALLQPLFLKRAGAASTLRTHVRTTIAFLAWCDAHGIDPWEVGANRIALHLRDAARRGSSVPKALWSSLERAREVFELGWCLSDPVVISQRQMSALKTEELREQAPPLTQHHMDGLFAIFYGAVQNKQTSVCIFAGFVLVLALGCLRWSDLQRSCGLELSKDSLFGETWKSKRKCRRMPWAAPRRDWSGRDWAGEFYSSLSTYLDLKTADFVVPAPASCGRRLEVAEPVRPARYLEALNVFRMIMRMVPGVQDPFVWSLHSPRFYFPSLASQLRYSLEERRALGRWGPASGMPVRYDRARCVTELLMKTEILGKLGSGFRPANDFELPSQPLLDEQNAIVSAARAGGGSSGTASGMQVSDFRNQKVDLVLNMRTMVAHVESEHTHGRARCAFWRPHSKSDIQALQGTLEELPGYTACPVCWKRIPNNFEVPEWSRPEQSNADDESQLSSCEVGSETSSGASQSS